MVTPNQPWSAFSDEVVRRLPVGPILSVTDISDALNLSRQAIVAWIESGELPATDCGAGDRHSYRVLKTNLIRFLQNRTTIHE